MENIILELRKGEKENIYGGEGRVVYVLNALVSTKNFLVTSRLKIK